jgi:hypothetical protein
VGPIWTAGKKRSEGPKKEEGFSPMEIPKRNTSAGGWKLRGTEKLNRWQPANLLLLTSAKGRDEPLARNLPEVELGTSVSGTGGITTPLQGAGSAGIPVAGGDQGSLVPRVGELRLEKKALSECARCKLKKSQSQVKRGRNWGHPATRNCRLD